MAANTFRFRLTTLLKLREAARDERRNRLAEAHRAEDIVANRIREIDTELAEQRRVPVTATMPGKRIQLDSLLEAERYELLLRAERQSVERQRGEIVEEIERRRLALVAADREVRILERLRENQAEQFAAEMNRRDIQQLDEVAARRYWREDDE
ncbi:MAG: flagellar export protein FliJ [Pirellulales bacterium]|nr:flagellar export protein FliJ [Pirellulales bacterium]